MSWRSLTFSICGFLHDFLHILRALSVAGYTEENGHLFKYVENMLMFIAFMSGYVILARLGM